MLNDFCAYLFIFLILCWFMLLPVPVLMGLLFFIGMFFALAAA